MFLAKIYITLKSTVNDPQGLTVLGALTTLGFADIDAVRVGKYLEVKLGEADEGVARTQIDEMCRKLLANPVIEEYRFELEELG